MKTRRIKKLFRLAGMGSVTFGAGCAFLGLWMAFCRGDRSLIDLVPDLIGGAVCMAMAVLMMRMGRDMMEYYRSK